MIITTLCFLIIALVYFYNRLRFNYWKKKGVKYVRPIIFFGFSAKSYIMQQSTSQMAENTYRKYPKERVVGTFRNSTPELLVRDPEIVKSILQTDFDYFQYRKIYPIHEEVQELSSCSLFNLDGDLWRLLRQRLTPAFTNGKLKAMFPLIVERAERIYERIYTEPAYAPIDAMDLMEYFTIDCIGSCAFGLDLDALNDENSKFEALGFKVLLKEMFPITFKHVKQRSEYNVIALVQTVFRQRNYDVAGRNDFIDFLLECKKIGKMVGESTEKFKTDGTPEQVSLELTNELLAAQVFCFFATGFETLSCTSSFTLHLLAYHPEKQKKVQDEIDRVLSQHNNELSYDALKEMTYLECAFKESLRIFPSIGYLARQCSRQYKFPNMDLTIDEGIKIMIPIQAMQNDPKYFESPEEFRPERFDPNVVDTEMTKFVYLPFGAGPRACIGERLGMMQSLIGLATVLSKFTVEPAPNSQRHPNIEAKPGIVQIIKGGLPLLFRERKEDSMNKFHVLLNKMERNMRAQLNASNLSSPRTVILNLEG